jgi:hypothetical protein
MNYTANVGLRATVIPTRPYKALPLSHSAKPPLFHRMPMVAIHQNSVAFSGAGIVPDLMTGGGRLVMMPQASRTNLEYGVVGREGMIPPAGIMPPLQKGQVPEQGAAGAGSFASSWAWNTPKGN